MKMHYQFCCFYYSKFFCSFTHLFIRPANFLKTSVLGMFLSPDCTVIGKNTQWLFHLISSTFMGPAVSTSRSYFFRTHGLFHFRQGSDFTVLGLNVMSFVQPNQILYIQIEWLFIFVLEN